MTDDTNTGGDGREDDEMTRRRMLGLGGAAVFGMSVAKNLTRDAPAVSARPASAGNSAGNSANHAAVLDALRPPIQPRSVWGDQLPVTGPLLPEEDVRFLLVHHTASSNEYGPDEVIGQIQNFYDLHTGPERNWPDVAYNFFIDRFGTIWEARSGSIAGPVRADATGGSQGFAILCSLIGNHAEVPVSEEAQAGLVAMLAWLGERYGVNTSPEATVDFVSRGSNLWPAGTEVRTATIAGHRDMSQTTCPGDFAYDLIRNQLPERVTAARLAAGSTLEAVTTTAPTPTLVPQDTSTVQPSTDTEPGAGAAAENSGAIQSEQALDDETTSNDRLSPLTVVGGTVAMAVVAAVAGASRLRRRPPRQL